MRGAGVQRQLLDNGRKPIIKDIHAGPALEYSHPDYAGNIGLITPYSKNFCDSCNRLRVSSQGKLHLCLFADDNMDLRPHLLNEPTQTLTARMRRRVLGTLGGHPRKQGHGGSTHHIKTTNKREKLWDTTPLTT